jgi:AcrR family transcriptional regulator
VEVVRVNAGRRGRRPDPAVDAAIREAVAGLLFERGFEMTFDDVAARAGVGRASVFRRFPTKRDMILDTVAQMTVAQIEVPDTGSVREDLIGALRGVMRLFDPPSMRPLARRVLGEACRDPAFVDLLRANMDRRLELFRTIFDRAVERGELPATTDPVLMADLVSGLVAIRLATETPLPGRGFSPSADPSADPSAHPGGGTDTDAGADTVGADEVSAEVGAAETDTIQVDEVAVLVDGLLYGFGEVRPSAGDTTNVTDAPPRDPCGPMCRLHVGRAAPSAD